MSKLIVAEFVSLNGVMEAPGGEPTHPHSGWTFKSHYGDDHYAYKDEELQEADLLLLGRKTYEGFAAAWPERGGKGDPFADKYNSMPKYVVSSTLTDPEWDEHHGALGRPDRGGQEAEGEQTRARSWCTAAPSSCTRSPRPTWSTTYRAMVHPVLVADGQRMFADPRTCRSSS